MFDNIQSSIMRMKKTVQAEAVLGCVIKDPKVGKVVANSLSQGDFIDPTHKKIFGAIEEIVKRGEEPSKHAIAGYFTDKELAILGGINTLNRIEKGSPSPQSVVSHIKGVKEQTMRKKLYRGLDRAKEKLNSMSPTIDAVKEISELSRAIASGLDNESGDIAKAFDKWKVEPDLKGISTGFGEIDRLTGGMKPGTLWVVASYLGVGKTMWLIKVMNNIQLASKNLCMFFSLEMQSARIVKRMAHDLSCRSQPEEKIRDFNVKLFTNKRSIAEIEYAIMTTNPKVVFVDYAQLIRSSGKSLFERMETVSNELQRIAQEHYCCIVVATQISNDYAKEPSNLLSAKGGQGLPACADVFIELFREDMQRDKTGLTFEPEIIVDVVMDLRKNRDGKTRKMSYQFDTNTGFIILPQEVEGKVEVVEMDFGQIPVPDELPKN